MRARGKHLALALLLPIFAHGCGAAVVVERPHNEALASADASMSAIELTELAGGASIASLVRDGDPGLGLSFAVLAPGDPAALVGLGEVLRARLEANGIQARLRVDMNALFLDVDVDVEAASAEHVTEVARAALSGPVAPAAGVAPAVRARLAAIPRGRDPAWLAVRRCTGQLALEPEASIDPGSRADVIRMEALRASMRLAVGVVGTAPAIERTRSALHAAGAWPPSPARAPRRDGLRLVASASHAPDLAPGAARLTIAMPIPDPSRAIAVATQIARGPSPLEARALALPVPFEVQRAVGTAGFEGGCVAVTLKPSDPPARAGDAQLVPSVAELAQAARDALSREVRSSPEPGLAARAVATTADAREAAQVAAWWALSGPGPEGAPPAVAISLELAASASTETIDEATRAVSSAVAAPPPEVSALPERSRIERGQGELWVLVASPCAAAAEPTHRWGSAAIAVFAAEARLRASAPGATVEAFVDANGIGFVAHAAARAGEPPGALATRVANAAASAFFVEAARTDELLLAEEGLRAALDDRWGRGAPGLGALGEALGERPALVEPMGPPGSNVALDASELARRLRGSSRESIRVAVLANTDASQATTATEAARRWFSPSALAAGDRCREAGLDLRPKRVDVRRPMRGPSRAHVVLSLSSREAALALEALLDGAGAGLAAALASVPGSVGRARVIAGGRGLAIEIAAPDDAIDAAVRAFEGSVERLARGEVAPQEVDRALLGARERARSRLSDPRERLARIFAGDADSATAPHGTSGTDSATPDLKGLIVRALHPPRMVVVVVRPE